MHICIGGFRHPSFAFLRGGLLLLVVIDHIFRK